MVTLTPRRCAARSYAIISGWTRSWLWRGWTKPLPHPDVLTRAGEDAEAIFGLTQMEKIQFDSEARSPVAAARELLDRVVSAEPPCRLISLLSRPSAPLILLLAPFLRVHTLCFGSKLIRSAMHGVGCRAAMLARRGGCWRQSSRGCEECR